MFSIFKTARTVLVVLLLILVSIFVFMFVDKKTKKEVCINNKCFEVEVVKTAGERARGLMFRENLPENRGMLFVFNKEDFYSFWMKNTKISLDIIWIGIDNKIVHIEKNALPCETENCQSYAPTEKAKYVLEINAGLVDKFGIKTGDLVSLPKNF